MIFEKTNCLFVNSTGIMLAYLLTVHASSEANNSSSRPGSGETTRRVHSGPKERTSHLLEERGVGDGSESIARVESRRYEMSRFVLNFD